MHLRLALVLRQAGVTLQMGSAASQPQLRRCSPSGLLVRSRQLQAMRFSSPWTQPSVPLPKREWLRLCCQPWLGYLSCSPTELQDLRPSPHQQQVRHPGASPLFPLRQHTKHSLASVRLALQGLLHPPSLQGDRQMCTPPWESCTQLHLNQARCPHLAADSW